MPVPHLNIRIVQRSKGSSAVAGAAYQAGEKLFSEYDQKNKDHRRKQKEVVYTEIMLPANAPPEYADRATLWNSAEEVEKQWNSQLARRFVIALPREVPLEMCPQMLKEYCEEHFVSKGMCCDFAIHDPDPPGHNPHCHIMLTMRAIDENGKWMPKSRKVYDLDENGERIKLPSGRWKSHKESTVDWNEQYHAEEWRHGWEVVQNKYLELVGSPERVDMRSYERQGIDVIPTVHMGAAVSAMERKGIETNIGNLNRDIKSANSLMAATRRCIWQVLPITKNYPNDLDAADVRHFLFCRGVMALAATRLIPMRKNKGKSIGTCLHNHTSYVQNPDKTEQGELVSSYQCSPLTVDEEFLLTKRLYEQTTGRSQKSDVIAYQVRQSFKPGEVTPEEANRIGYEFAERFLKGKHAFIVATHTDRAHIHNHIIYNSTALDGTRKFKNFWLSTFAVQRLSDLICLEHQLSTIEYKPYRERQKRIVYPPKKSNRDRLCGIIDTILAEKPGDYEAFLQKLEQQGYEVKRGKYTAVKGKGQKRFIRFRTLGTGYGEDEIKAVLEGKAKHHPYQKQPPKEQPFQLLVDIQGKMAEGKSVGYKKWATKFNLKEMSKTLLFLQEQKIGSAEELRQRAAAATERYHTMGDSIKAAEARLTEIAVLKTHIINYAKTREVYAAYRKAGYSKAFLEAHREEITLHKAAKAAFDEAGLQKLPKVKELDAEFAELLTQKKATYPDYRKARNEMQELVRAQKNVERFFAEEKDTIEKTQTR